MSTAGRPAAEPLLRLRPLGLGEILDDIFRVYRRHFGLALWPSPTTGCPISRAGPGS